MTSTKAFTTERTQAVFEAACAFAGLDATDAKRVRFGENAIYRLADGSAVVRVGRSIPAATKEALEKMGYPVKVGSPWSRTELIRIVDGKIEAVGDWRGDDSVAGE